MTGNWPGSLIARPLWGLSRGGCLREIFPEAILNLRPGDKLKHPLQLDSG